MDATLYASIDRREVLRRIAMLVGTAISAPTLVGMMRGDASLWMAARESDWKPRVLTARQSELAATVAEHIIPTTDTPGARAAGAHRFIDAMLSDYYAVSERNRFVAGLNGLDLQAWQRHLKPFVACAASQQAAMLTELDRDTYARHPEKARLHAARPSRLSRLAYGRSLSGWFWRRMKELTLVGYYTSQVGAILELHVDPRGEWRSDIRNLGQHGNTRSTQT